MTDYPDDEVGVGPHPRPWPKGCLLYTSDAADE